MSGLKAPTPDIFVLGFALASLDVMALEDQGN